MNVGKLKSNASVCVEEIVPEYLNYRNNKVDDLYMENYYPTM